MAGHWEYIACQRSDKTEHSEGSGLRRKNTDATGSAKPMNKAIKVLLYASVIVVGWRALRYWHERLLASADLAAEQSYVRDRRAYRRAIARWENEGGATLAGHTSGPSHSK